MKKLRLFSTSIHRNALPHKQAKRWLPELIREAKLFRELDEAGEKWSRKNYPNGYTSYSSITDLAFRSSRFGELRRWIDREVQRFVRDLEYDLDRGSLEMEDFWINIMEKGCCHPFHLHPLSVVSGTFYLQIPKGTAGIQFEDPRLPSLMACPPLRSAAKSESGRFYTLQPKSGEVVLFESWLKHQVPLQTSKSERISVSFNYQWKRGKK